MTTMDTNERQRLVDLVLDLAERDAGECLTLASDPEEERQAEQLVDDVQAARPMIEAVPDLLEACKGLLREMWCDRKPDVRKHFSLMVHEEAARSAIRKA